MCQVEPFHAGFFIPFYKVFYFYLLIELNLAITSVNGIDRNQKKKESEKRKKKLGHFLGVCKYDGTL